MTSGYPIVDGAPADDRGEAPASAPPLRERCERPLPEETFPESPLEGLETSEGPPIEIEPDCSLPDRERGGRRGGFEGGGIAGGCGKCGKTGVGSPPGTLSSDHVTLRFDLRVAFDPRDDRLRRLPLDIFS